MRSHLGVIVISAVIGGRADAAPPKFDKTVVPAGTAWWCGKVPMCFRAKAACENLIGPCKSQTTAWAYTDDAKHDISVFGDSASCKEERKNRDDLSACTSVGAKAAKPYKEGPKGSGYWCFGLDRGPAGSICARDQDSCATVHDSLHGTTACHASKTAWAFMIEEGEFSVDAPVVETKAHCTKMLETALTAVGPCRELH